MYPWGFSREPLPDFQQLHDVGIEMSKAIFNVSGHDYWVRKKLQVLTIDLKQILFFIFTILKVGSASDTMYVTSGSSDDWFRGVAKIKWVFLFELPDKVHYKTYCILVDFTFT